MLICNTLFTKRIRHTIYRSNMVKRYHNSNTVWQYCDVLPETSRNHSRFLAPHRWHIESDVALCPSPDIPRASGDEEIRKQPASIWFGLYFYFIYWYNLATGTRQYQFYLTNRNLVKAISWDVGSESCHCQKETRTAFAWVLRTHGL